MKDLKMIKWLLSFIRKPIPYNDYYCIRVDYGHNHYVEETVYIESKRFRVMAIVNRDLILKELTNSPT